MQCNSNAMASTDILPYSSVSSHVSMSISNREQSIIQIQNRIHIIQEKQDFIGILHYKLNTFY